jgi:hypothetical protein
MGLTCAALHLSTTADLDTLAQAVGQRLGCDQVESSDAADREFAAVISAPWISFFDLSNPNAVTDELAELGKQLSVISKEPVLLAAVWDSDVFGFMLFENGKQVDGYASGRGLLTGRIKKLPPDKRAVEWSRAFKRPLASGALESVVQKGHLFAEDQLAKLSDLLGFSPKIAMCTAKDLKSQQLPNQRRYYFRSRPSQGNKLPITQTLPYKGATLPMQIVVRQDRFGSFELNGPAEAFVDPVFEFAGSAVDSEIVNVTEAHAFWSLGIDHILAGGAVRFDGDLTTEEANGRRLCHASLKGLSAQQRSFPPRKKSILSFCFTLRGVSPGAGEIQVNCRPSPHASESLPLRPQFLVEVIR